ncbi:MAG: ATP synthase subunit I [Polyangiaceae bacterium]|jgi:F1F0 ATPase subunit 2
MNEVVNSVFAWASGALLGAAFFGGLWWTVRRSSSSKRQAPWLVASFLLRMTVALSGFYFVAVGGHWLRIIFCLVGFMTARSVVTRLTQPSGPARSRLGRKGRHAPQP